MTKIVFMGTPAFSVPILEGLLEAGYEVAAVVTQPDRPVGRKKTITPTPVKEAAMKHGLLVLQPEKISGSPEMEQIQALAPDLLITAAFGQFLPSALLEVPSMALSTFMRPYCRNTVAEHLCIMPLWKGSKKRV